MAQRPRMERTAGEVRLDPDVPHRPAPRGGWRVPLHDLRRLPHLRGQPRRLVQRPADLAHVDRDDRRRHAPLLAFRRTARCRLGARGVRVVRRLGPVGREHGDAGAHARRSRHVDPHRRTVGHRGRALGTLQPRLDPIPRRRTDRPGVRVSDAGRPLLLHRLRRCRGRDHDLRDPAVYPHHRSRHPSGTA